MLPLSSSDWWWASRYFDTPEEILQEHHRQRQIFMPEASKLQTLMMTQTWNIPAIFQSCHHYESANESWTATNNCNEINKKTFKINQRKQHKIQFKFKAHQIKIKPTSFSVPKLTDQKNNPSKIINGFCIKKWLNEKIEHLFLFYVPSCPSYVIELLSFHAQKHKSQVVNPSDTSSVKKINDIRFFFLKHLKTVMG